MSGDPPPSPAVEVFISYASHDAAVANAVVEILERHGITCWIAPRDVVPGSLYADEIVGAINDAKAVVLVLSEHSLASPHVGKEIERASSKRRRIITLHIDSAPLTRAFEYFLSESQWVDVGNAGIEAAAAKLVVGVRRQLNPATANEVRHSQPAVNLKRTSARRRSVVIVGAAVVVAGAFTLVIDRVRLSTHGAEERPAAPAVRAPEILATPLVPEKSVAVLPFVDMSERKDQEYFSDGLSEELIDMLAKIPDLRVPARTSSFYFKGRQTTIGEIAKALGVTHVLEGSVRKSGNTLRVTAQLIRVDNGYHVWSQTFDRRLDDVFKVQDEIAASVVQILKVKLLSQPLAQPARTRNTAAYTSYLQGRFFASHNNRDAYAHAIPLFEQAVHDDPAYALGWAGLARVVARSADHGWIPLAAGYDRARAAAAKSLQLDPNLVEGHAMMAYIKSNYDWDWEGDKKEADIALAGDPTNVDALLVRAQLAFALGQSDDAIRTYQEVLVHDPLSTDALRYLAWQLLYAGRLAESETVARRLIELDPAHGSVLDQLGHVYLARGDPRTALTLIEQESDEYWRSMSLPIVYRALGREADSVQALRSVEAKYGDQGAYQIAEVHAYRGEVDAAFEWLERAIVERDGGLTWIKVDNLVANLRSDPRYKTILRKMNLPE
ncbi:MAG: TIR domain-containing protein [Steroidobacteraceae bacterium]